MLWAFGIILLQTGFIVSLLYERRRRRTADASAQDRMEELARLNLAAALSELSASIAHRLLQPLTAILLNTEAAALILKGSSGELSKLEEIIQDIGSEDRRAAEMITRLRGRLTKAPGNVCDIELNAAVHGIIELLSMQAVARRITLAVSYVQSEVRVEADRSQIQQVILNLILNAMDAIESARGARDAISVRIAVLAGLGLAEVRIEDSGSGIPMGQEDTIFEPFFTTKKEGLGMGLAIARTIIQAHGGILRAENGEGGGAVFRFTLPLSNASVGLDSERACGLGPRSARQRLALISRPLSGCKGRAFIG